MTTEESVVRELLDQLCDYAKTKGINKAQLAALAGMPRSTLSRAYARNACTIQTLDALAKPLGLKITLVPNNDLASKLAAGEVF